MSRELILLRHAKSDRNQEVGDFERPLSERGQRDAARVGRWIVEHGIEPDLILSSPARRAAQTADAVCTALSADVAAVRWDGRLYLASLPTLLQCLSSLPAATRCVILIGHNPGLEDLLLWLAPAAEQQRQEDKLLTTATLARLQLSGADWRLRTHGASLRDFVRPRDLK